MNERIKELALEARLGPALMLQYWKNIDALTDSEQAELEQLEKFAELIVQECSAVANHFSDGHEVRQFDDSKRYLYFVDVGKVVLEHFGVKE